MEQYEKTWFTTTKNIFTAVLIFSIATVVQAIMALFGGAQDMVSSAASLMGASTGFNFYNLVKWICIIGMAGGYLLYVMGLGKLSIMLKEKDMKAVGQVRIGGAILILTSLTLFFPLPVWLAWIVRVAELAAYVMMFVGFGTLKKSHAIDSKAARGFSTVYLATLFSIIAMLLGWLIYVSFALGAVMSVIGGILEIVAIILVIVGWATVKGAPAK